MRVAVSPQNLGSSALLATLSLLPTPEQLKIAVREDDASLVHDICQRGASPNVPDDSGFQPLHHAAWAGSLSVAAVLLAAGASSDAALPDGGTPMHIAAVAGAVDVLDLLLRFGGSPDARDDAQQTPLHAAVAAGMSESCELCLEAGASIDTPDVHGFSPLRWAVLNGHDEVVRLLCAAGADCETPLEGMTPLMLAAAADHAAVVEVLLATGLRPSADAEQVARSMGHDDALRLLLAGVAPSVAAAPPPPPPPPPPAAAEVRVTTLAELERDPSLWHAAFAESVPLLVHGCGVGGVGDGAATTDGGDDTGDGAPGGGWAAADLARRWGEQPVSVTFSPDEKYQRPTLPAGHTGHTRKRGPRSSVLREGPTTTMTFGDFVRLLPTHHGVREEHFAVQQHVAASLAAFDGLPPTPPLLETLMGGGERRSNLWACAPPKLSALHHDSDDSVLLQLSGAKRFTLVDPAPLHGLTTYPAVQRFAELERVAPGVYRPAAAPAADRSASHFPLVNVTHPDLQRHPLFRYARVTTVDVPAGSALLLPAFWYHQVESFAPPGTLNVAVNHWFDGAPDDGGASPAAMHRILRSKLRVNCL